MRTSSARAPNRPRRAFLFVIGASLLAACSFQTVGAGVPPDQIVMPDGSTGPQSGDDAGPGNSQNQPATIQITPQTQTIDQEQHIQFSAAVQGPNDTSVVWSVREPTGGTIDPNGGYTAPASGGTFHIVATSVADPTASASATVNVQSPDVTVQPPNAIVEQGDSVPFAATVTNAPDGSVSWSVQEAGGGTIGPDGTYTAPMKPGSYHVVATSTFDPTRTRVVPVGVPPVLLTITPGSPAVTLGGHAQFGAAVSGTTSTSVTWSVVEGNGGSITPLGAYTAPNVSGIFHVKATSTFDPTASSNAPVLVGAVEPQLLASGSNILPNPVFTSVTWPSDTLAATFDAFLSSVGSTSYWTAITSEYGVSSGSAKSAIHLVEQPPTTIDDAAIQTWLTGKLTGPTPSFGAPTSNSIYVLFYPAATTTITGPAGAGTSCKDFAGYHYYFNVPNGPRVQYAVIPRCPGYTTDQYTAVTSHELAETVTDPVPGQGWAFNDTPHAIWGLVLGDETGDLCAWNGISSSTEPYKVSGFNYGIERMWSNASASAGHDPCVPELPGEIYFHAVPIMNDTVQIDYNGFPFPTTGVKIPIGSSVQIPVQLAADGAMAAWKVAADTQMSGATPTLQFTWDLTTGSSGQTLHLTIKALLQDAKYGGEPFRICSTNSSNAGDYHCTYGFVAN